MADANFTPVKFAVNTGASGTYDVTQSGMSAAGDIAAALIFMTSATADDTKTANMIQSIGFVDGTRQLAYAAAAEDNVATTNNGRRHDDGACIVQTNPTNGARVFDHSFNSFITDGIRLNIDDQAGSAFLGTIVFIHGTDVANVYCEIVDDLGTSTTAQSITAPGFEPDVVFVLSDFFGGVPPNQLSSLTAGFGVALNNVGEDNVCAAWHTRDNIGTSAATGILRNNACIAGIFAVDNWRASIDNYAANGFDITVTGIAAPDAGNDNFGYLAVKFNNSPDLAIGDMSWPTSGNYAETGPGFAPDSGLICAISGVDSRNTLDTTGPYGVSITVFDDTNINALSFSGEDALATSNENSRHSDSLSLADAAGDQEVVATYALDSLGWDFTISTNPAAAILGWWFAIGPGAAGGRIMSSLTRHGGLAGYGGIAGKGGGLAG
jgi:hypothetical protein